MRAKRMMIFLGEADQWRHKPLYLAILERLKADGCAGATVVRGIAGFGPHSQITTSRLLDISLDLPIVVTAVDRADRIERFAGEVAEMLTSGVVVLEDVDVHFYSAAFRGGLPDVEVRDVMSRQPECVTPETPLVEVVHRLLERDYNELPVIDADRQVIGVVGDHDLLERGLLSQSVRLHKVAGPDALHDAIRALTSSGGVVRDVMTAPAVTVPDSMRLPDAARLMHERHRRRLPVVDAGGRLVGVLGRLDILNTIATGYARRTAPRTLRLPQEHRTVGEIMERDVPTVPPTTPLGDVVEQLLASTAEEVVVADADGRPVGIITDAHVLERADPLERPGLLTQLRSRWNREAERQVRRASAQRASDLMVTPVVTVRDTDPVMVALTLSATRHLKRLPVVDGAGRLVGIVARPALLGASLDG
jgi:CBS domain-containing protein